MSFPLRLDLKSCWSKMMAQTSPCKVVVDRFFATFALARSVHGPNPILRPAFFFRYLRVLSFIKKTKISQDSAPAYRPQEALVV